MSAANSMSIKNLNSTLKISQVISIPLPPSLPPTKMGIVKQGIVSILGSESDKRNKGAGASIRRTLSADMSSKKWLSQNGFSPMKKIASSKELDVLGSQDEVWRSIQKTNEPTSNDVWSSILTQKKQESSTFPPPYVHPLLKKISSSLTEKSLEICTESLGSETGSEIIRLSSYSDEDKDDHPQKQEEEKEEIFEEFPVVKFNHNKKTSSTPPKCFPPPISSLAAEDKPSVHMQSHRQNGRLILEAVSVPPQNHFRAQRVDGRLLLTLITTSSEIEAEDITHQQVFDDNQQIGHNEPDNLDEVEEKGNGTKGMQIVLVQKSRLSNGRMNVNTSTLMMKQLMGGLDNQHHLTCPNKFNKSIKLIEQEDQLTPNIPQSLPQISPHLITSPEPASFNAYNYFWKKNPNPSVTTIANSTTKIAEHQDLVLMRGNKANINYLVPLLKGCKEQRKSLLIWEPYCIATS
ncbi:protein FAF-like, chloroplastic [Solanum dulcamara]|uniref:protein FAF-like, chloroplastic n=1 Tax=Solanum dulcamara TaxID=45834 RepID=UPI0024863294|nr:protein FAF-like, chloroplastic [Solanum dulcamara]